MEDFTKVSLVNATNSECPEKKNLGLLILRIGSMITIW